MFERLDAPEHVLGVRFAGKVSGDDIKAYQRLLDEKLAAQPCLNAYIEFDVADMEADAFLQGAKADMRLLSHLRQFDRCAFVSDEQWPRALVNFFNPILTGLDMQVFAVDEQDAAKDWVAAAPRTGDDREPALRFLDTTDDDVLAFEINGVISAAEMPEVIKRFEAFLGTRDRVRMLNRVKYFSGVEPAVFMQGGLASVKLAAIRKVERYAIVGAPGWMAKVAETVNPAFANMDMRVFAAEDEAEAWAWIGAEPA